MNRKLQRLWRLILVTVLLLAGCGESDTIEIPEETVAPPSKVQPAGDEMKAPAMKPLPPS